jgi:outer membrane protein W
MKKHIQILAILLLMSQLGKAQNLSFGPMVGLNLSEISNLPNSSTKTGLLIGGFFNYSHKSSFGVGVQVLYNQLGANLNNNTEQIRLNYLQVPVLATYYFGPKNAVGVIRPKLFIGPHLNFLLNATNKAGNDINTNESQFNTTDFGGTLGGGLNYSVSKKVWLNFDVRYNFGLIDISKNPSLVNHNQSLGINVGLSFPLGNI